LSQNPSPSPEEENQIPSPQRDIPASPELVEQARKRVSNIIVVDLIKDKRVKLNHTSEVSQLSIGFKTGNLIIYLSFSISIHTTMKGVPVA
jgi:hypothetical protein